MKLLQYISELNPNYLKQLQKILNGCLCIIYIILQAIYKLTDIVSTYSVWHVVYLLSWPATYTHTYKIDVINIAEGCYDNVLQREMMTSDVDKYDFIEMHVAVSAAVPP